MVVTFSIQLQAGDATGNFNIQTDDQGKATAKDLASGSYVVGVKTPAGYKATTPLSHEVRVKETDHDLTFGMQKTLKPVASPSATPGAASSTAPTAAPAIGNTGGNVPAAQVAQTTGSLPKTGQAGLIAVLTFVLAGATYYGTQFYRSHKRR